MLILDTPIVFGKYTYPRMVGGIKGGWDLRNRTVEAVISLAREQEGKTVIGTLEKGGEQMRVLPPPIVDTFALNDSFPHDPALTLLFQKLHEVTEEIEKIIIAKQHLAHKSFVVGEEEVSLACTFMASAAPAQLEEKQKKPKEEPAPEPVPDPLPVETPVGEPPTEEKDKQ